MLNPTQASSPSDESASVIDLTKLDQTILRPSPDVQGTSMDGETVLLDLSTGRYYTLNRIGSVIWEQCTGHTTLHAIHAGICDRFDVPSDRALDDLLTVVNELVREGLLQQGGG